ncbi:kiaa1614 [Pungitius sinensis]
MKRRCVPLRADHKLLTPDTHSLSGVRLPPVIQVRLEGVASPSGHPGHSSGGESSARSPRRRPGTSPTRRLRFEDETETEAECRYLERQWQRRRGGQRATGVLVSKPNLNQYVNGMAGHAVDRKQRGRTSLGGLGQWDSCGTVLGGGVNLSLRLYPPAPEDPGRSARIPRLNLRTEPIRETYIGSVTPGQVDGRRARTAQFVNHNLRRTTGQVKLHGSQTSTPQAASTADLPINPYAPDQLTTQPSSNNPHSLSPPAVTSSPKSQSVRPNGTKAAQNLSRSREEKEPPAAKPVGQHGSGAELEQKSPSVEEGGLGLTMKNSSSSSGGSEETTAGSQAPAKSGSSGDREAGQPLRARDDGDDTSGPECLISRNEPSRLSLRRLFSNVRLSRTRAGSLDRLGSRPDPSGADPTPAVPKKSSGLLKKTPSVVHGSTFSQLRKSLSVESFVLEQKKKKTDRSADYRPAADQLLQRCLSIEDVSCPSSVRSIGRVLQVCSDGTFLLEVIRPKSQMYGFIISRGRGRPDSGVYVEDMVDSSTKKLYAGLLTVGDEILEVNGEKVACLSLDQVTHMLTESTSATLRVLRHQNTACA